jgi:hypothetical protein
MSPETRLRVACFRASAEKCDDRANQVQPRLTALYRGLAEQWRELAWQLEQIVDPDAPPSER